MRRPRTVLLTVALALLVACGGTGDDAGGTPPATEATDAATDAATPTASPTGTASPAAACGGYEPGSQVTDQRVLVVDEPGPEDALPSGATVTGCTNAFEATFEWELLDADGQVLATDHGTASCGNGCVGTFSFDVAYQVDTAQAGTLRVFTTSAEDGSVQDEVRLPVRLEP